VKVVVDAKFLSKKPLRSLALSGKALLVIVSIGVLASSLILDGIASQLGQLQSLTIPL